MDIISWPFLTLITLVFWVISILIDKYMLNRIKDPMIYWALASFANLAVALIVWTTVGMNIQSDLALIVVAAGVLTVFTAWTYYHAIEVDEVSRTYPLMSISIPATVFLSAVFLGEIFNFVTYIGIALLLAGAIILSTRFDKRLRKLVRSAAVPYVLGGAVIGAGITVARKWALLQVDWLQVLAFGSFGVWLGFMALLYYRRSELSAVIRQRRWLLWGGISTVLTLLGVVTLTLAYSLGPASLVSSLAAAEPVVLFAAALGISIWRPKILREELHGSTIVVKAVAIALVVIGGILITT